MSFYKNEDSKKPCSEAGSLIRLIRRHRWLIWLYPFIGLAALVWFLVRVIPKPSRATYPCQRVAFPLASSFIIWLLGIFGSAVAFQKAKRAVSRARYVLAVICIVLSVGLIWAAMSGTNEEPVYAHDPPVPNSPIGVARGVNPGRVVWIHDADAANWTGYDGDDDSEPYWFSDTSTDQTVVNEMFSEGIKALTGRSTDAGAWDSIFRYYNQKKGKGNVGYTAGEKIVIKVNFVLANNASGGEKFPEYLDQIDNSPQLTRALLRQLIDEAGVSPGDISIGDPLQQMPNYWYDMVYDECPGVVYLTRPGVTLDGRTNETLDTDEGFCFSDPNFDNWAGVTKFDYMPTHFSEAEYLINFAILKTHNDAGVTLSGKNHYGSLMRSPIETDYYDMHQTRATDTPGMGHYRAIVDLMGYPSLGGKTVLVLIDGLYSGQSWDAHPYRWDMAPFYGDWPSSIFLSQDQVAADSVAFDFLYNEFDGSPWYKFAYPHYSGADDYLHEAALIPNASTPYACDCVTGEPVTESLGVHEHWNNASGKQYSRNLDPVNGTGIELVTEWELIGDFDGDVDIDFEDFAILTAAYGSEPGDGNWNADCDISVPSDNIIDEKDVIRFCTNWLY